jgi:hypothetical protein
MFARLNPTTYTLDVKSLRLAKVGENSDVLTWFDKKPPNKFKTAYLYYKRAINRDMTSFPYLAGDNFAAICQLRVSKKNSLSDIDKNTLSSIESIFIDSELFNRFANMYSQYLKDGVILVTGNGDEEFHEIPETLKDKNFTWYAQNSFIDFDKRVRLLPAGVENLDYWGTGLPKYLKQKKDREKMISDKILFGPYGKTHPSRLDDIEKAFQQLDLFDIPIERLSPKKYAYISSNYKFVYCPRGNGIESHRFWETLYRGGIPIIKISVWSRQLRELQIPFEEIERLDDLDSGFIEMLNERWKSTPEPSDINSLWMPFWTEKVTLK